MCSSPTPLGAKGGPEIQIQWASPDSLEVRFDPRVRVFERDPYVSGINVRFVSEAPRN